MLLYTNLYAQQDTLYLSLQQLFERGTEQHLQLAADRLKEKMANERAKTARTARLPELNVGLKGGFLGQPVIQTHPTGNRITPSISLNPSTREGKSGIPSVKLTCSKK